MSDNVANPPRWNIAPYFIVDDVVTTANYYRDKLGFQYVESDRPSPVQSITCAARQAGHLGANTRMALGRTHAKISRTLRTHVGVFRSPAALQQALIALSPSDSCVPPARECAPASAPSLWASRRDVRAGSILWRGGGTQGASRPPPPSSGIAGD